MDLLEPEATDMCHPFSLLNSKARLMSDSATCDPDLLSGHVWPAARNAG